MSAHIRWGGSTFVVKSTGLYPAVGVKSGEVSAVVWPGRSRPSGPPFVGSPGSRGPSRGSARLGGAPGPVPPGGEARWIKSAGEGGPRAWKSRGFGWLSRQLDERGELAWCLRS